jgi:hypothetical protein
MELDELKESWKKTGTNDKKSKLNIMELIQHPSYGPVATLKREYRKLIILLVVMPLCLLLTNAQDITKPLTSILFWFYTLFCFGMIYYFTRNLKLLDKISRMDNPVKENIQQQVSILENRLRIQMKLKVYIFLIFILLVEVVPYIQDYRMLNTWHNLPILIRLGSYSALILLQHFLSRAVLQKKFGQHISYLKEMLKEME